MEVVKYDVTYYAQYGNEITALVTVVYANNPDRSQEDLLSGRYITMHIAQNAVNNAINRHRAKLKKEKEQKKDGL